MHLMQADAKDRSWNTVGAQLAVATSISPGANRTMSAVDGKTGVVHDVRLAYGTSCRDAIVWHARSVALYGYWIADDEAFAAHIEASGAATGQDQVAEVRAHATGESVADLAEHAMCRTNARPLIGPRRGGWL